MRITGCAGRNNKEVIIQKIRNRIISFVVIFALIPVLLAVPAFAAEDQYLVDLKAYNFGINQVAGEGASFDGFSFSTYKDSTFQFPMPNSSPVYYVDFIIQGDGALPWDLQAYVGDVRLTGVRFGDNNDLYRFYGPVSQKNVFTGYIPVRLYQPTSNYLLRGNFISFKYSDTSSPFILEPGSQYLTADSDVNSWSGSDPGYGRYIESPSVMYYTIHIPSWQKYDRYDLVVQVSAYSISSIDVYVDGGGSVPFTYSFIDGSADFYNIPNLISLQLDASDVERLSGDIIVEFIGTVNVGSTWFRCFEINAFVNSSAPSPEVSWLGRIWNSIENWGQNIVDAILGSKDNAPDTSAGDDLVNQGQQIQDFEHQHQEVINGNTGAITDSLDITGFVPALSLISSYVGNTFDILGPYQQVILVPISIGLFMFICSRVPGNSVGRVSRVSTRSIDPKSKEV